jgi:hypothetical protein
VPGVRSAGRAFGRCCGGAGQGRGSRATALRSARALAVSPISASSAAACAAVPRMRRPAGSSGRCPLTAGGTPGGCAGWRRRSGRGLVARAGAVSTPAAALSAVDRFRREPAPAPAPRARADEVRLAAGALGGVGPDPPDAGVRSGADPFAGGGVARLSLRRWGRRRGSEPRTSAGRSSLTLYIMAHQGDRRRTGCRNTARRRRS